MRATLDGLYRLCGFIAGFFIVAICAVVTVQVIFNLIDRIASLLTGSAIGLTIPSYSDFTGYFLTATSFFALAYTLRAGGHIRVSLVIQALPDKPRRIVEIWCLSFAAALATYFTWYIGALVHESWAFNDLSAGIIAVPIWIPQLSMLLGMTVLTIALFDDLVAVLRGRQPSYFGKGDDLLSADDQIGSGAGGGEERSS